MDTAEKAGAASSIGPDEPTQDSVSIARPMPAQTPATEPATPSARAWRRT